MSKGGAEPARRRDSDRLAGTGVPAARPQESLRPPMASTSL
nr:MAG TPA: hypothetical protein [Caudoviricetes sp.]